MCRRFGKVILTSSFAERCIREKVVMSFLSSSNEYTCFECRYCQLPESILSKNKERSAFQKDVVANKILV
jgi:hypothetical protein